MQATHINPFVEAVYELFDTKLHGRVERGSIGVTGGNGPGDVLAIIGISGLRRGTVSIGFPTPTALAVVGRLLGSPVAQMDEAVSNGVAEIVTIVAGNAKGKLNAESDRLLDLSVPMVVRGERYNVQHPSKSVWLEVPFNSELGGFILRVTFETIVK